MRRARLRPADRGRRARDRRGRRDARSAWRHGRGGRGRSRDARRRRQAAGGRAAAGRSTRCWPMPGAAWAGPSSTRTSTRCARVIDTNVTGTVYLLHKVGRDMRDRGEGRILITGSIAGFMPGTYQAVYNGTKAFLDSFSFALRAELKDTRRHRDLPDAGRHRDRILRARRHAGHQGRPAEEGRSGRRRQGRLRGDDGRRGRRRHRLAEQAAVRPSPISRRPASLAEQHRQMAEPGSAFKK